MDGGAHTKRVEGSNLKLYLRTMQMDLEEAKSGVAQKETHVVSLAQPRAAAQPKIAFDKLAQEMKAKPQSVARGAARSMETDLGAIAQSAAPAPSQPKKPIIEFQRPALSSDARPSTPDIQSAPLREAPQPQHIELRPLRTDVGPTSDVAAPKPQAPLKPAFAVRPLQSRELDPTFTDAKKRTTTSFHVPRFVWVILVLLVIGFGVVAFGGVEYINNFITTLFPRDTAPPSAQPPSTTPPDTAPPAPPPPSLGTKIIEVSQSQPHTLSNTIRSALAEKYPLNTLNPVTVRYLETKQPLDFSEFWSAFNVIVPFGLLDSLEESFTLVVHTSDTDAKRFGIRIRTQSSADATKLRNQLLSWEGKFVSDWQVLLSSLPAHSQGQFQTITLLGERVRFINTDMADLGIYYTLMAEKGVLLIGTSRETLEALIANER